MPANSIVQYEKDPVGQAVYSLCALLDEEGEEEHMHRVRGQVKSAVSVIEEYLDKYSLDEVCLGFNGGKHCTALLHLAHEK